MTESVDRQTAVLRLRGAQDILILCHKNPDGDTIGSAGALYLALKALGKNVAVLCSDPIPSLYDFMEIGWFDSSFTPAFVVAVDVAGIQLFGGVYWIAGAGSAETVSLSSPMLWTFPMLVFRWFPGFAATGQLVLPQKETPFYLDTLPLLGLCLLLMALCGALMVRLGRRQEV